MPSWFRWSLVVIATVILCSCSAPMNKRLMESPPSLPPVVMGTSAYPVAGSQPQAPTETPASLDVGAKQADAQLAPVVRRSDLAFESPASESAVYFVTSEDESFPQDSNQWDSPPPIPEPSLVTVEASIPGSQTPVAASSNDLLLDDPAEKVLLSADPTGDEPQHAVPATVDEVDIATVTKAESEQYMGKHQRRAVFRRINEEPDIVPSTDATLVTAEHDLRPESLDIRPSNDLTASPADVTVLSNEGFVTQEPLSPIGQPGAIPLETVPAEIPQDTLYSPALPGVAACAPPAATVPCGPTVPPWQMYPDEYLCDGGDAAYSVRVNQDWSVRNLDPEDTVGHYDTLDGRVLVEPSNRVCIYAPRFAAVRKVTAVSENETALRPLAADRPDQAVTEKRAQIDEQYSQHETAERHLLIQQASIFRDRLPPTEAVSPAALSQYVRDFAPHEDFHIVRWGVHKQAEKARLAEFTDAAITWSHDAAVQVILDDQEALSRVTVQGIETVFEFEKRGTPRLRVCKTASTADAQPGEIVEFALRFDNVGQQPIGNVTIIDNLTTRLEYVPDSAKCSLEAGFFTDENDAESLVLRWEIDDPLEPGKGGIIRFKCRVR